MKKTADALIAELVEYGVRTELIKDTDRAFVTAQIMDIMGMSDLDQSGEVNSERPLNEILDDRHQNYGRARCKTVGRD